jgi:hypothetical protein
MKVMNHMNYECEKLNEVDKDAYICFMCDPNNSYNCNECPERESGNDDRLPCGQQNCWVDVHCKAN